MVMDTQSTATADENADSNVENSVGRRGALRRLMTLAAAAFAGGALLHPEKADATTGAMTFGTPNDAGVDATELSSNSEDWTLDLENGGNGDGLFVSKFTNSPGNGIVVSSVGQGDGISATRSNLFVAGAAVYAQQSLSGPVYHAVSNAPGNSEPLFEGEHNGVGAGLEVSLTNAANAGAVINASTVGVGPGVHVSLTHPTNSRSAVGATTAGTGPAINGVIANSASNSNAVEGTTNGTGSGVYGTTSGPGPAVRGDGGAHGRGAAFVSNVAQMRLAPGAGSTHPKSGKAGDLYVDRSIRLWFCKGGTSWKQVA